MNIETLVYMGTIYAIGFYVTAFLLGIGNAVYRIGDNGDDWFISIFWPICILMFIVMGFMAGLAMLCHWAFLKMRSRFPAMMKCVQTTIFAVSLPFRPVKFGEIVGKRIFRKGKTE